MGGFKRFLRWTALVFPVSAGKTFILWLWLRRGLLDSPQSLVNAAGQSVGRVGEAFGMTLLLRSGPYLPKPDALSDLSQDIVAVVIRIRAQDPQLSLPQVETAPLEWCQHLIHGRARWEHRAETISLTVFRGLVRRLAHSQTTYCWHTI